MGARPSSFKQGGGFLNGVDATLTDYQFTDEFNGEEYRPGKIKDFRTGKPVDKPHSLNVFVSFRVDGADQDTTTTLKAAGNFEDWEVSEDGHTVTPIQDGQKLPSGTAWYKFIASLCQPTNGAEGFPVDRLSDDDDPTVNYEPIIGTRVRLVQQVDEDRTKRFGPKKDKKTGKEYERKDLVVEAVYDLPVAARKANGQSAAPGKAKSAVKSKATKPAADDVAEFAAETLRDILADNDGKIAKSKLSMKILNKLMKHPQREDVRKYLGNDENLAGIEGVCYDVSDKNQIVSLEA